MKKYDVAIIGAGTAGLSARREVTKQTDSYVVIDDGPLGTTCVRTGCMPSKVLIQVANDFHRRHKFAEEGIQGGPNLTIDHRQVMTHVQKLRDRFLRAVLKDMETWTSNHLLNKRATFVSENQLDIGGERISADKIIIATGSRPVIPSAWAKVRGHLIDTNDLFSLSELPRSVAVIGLGVIGIELGQALARLGVCAQGITLDKAIGGLTDPEIQEYAYQKLQEELPIALSSVEDIQFGGNQLQIRTEKQTIAVDKAFVAMGRKPNLEGLGLETLGITLDDRGLPPYTPGVYRIGSTSIFIVGDANGDRPILHEAADEGRIAGFNSVTSPDQCFQRRTKIAITFTEPNIALVGETYGELVARKEDFVTGKANFEGQGRAIVKLQESGLLHVYADRRSGALLGAEMFCPDGEHLAHLLSWAIAANMNVHQLLSMPFYHPVIEEGLRTAIRNAAAQIPEQAQRLETARCSDPPVGCWA